MMLPEYFFEVAASSTGKYHPKYALGEGGLVRHTKAAVAIAKDLLSLEMYGKYTQDEKDLILVALMLHDGMKHGEPKSAYSKADHPSIVADWLRGNKGFTDMLPEPQLQVLAGAIESHMGQWNTDYRTKKEILPKPKTAIQKMVHMCDYLASRKYLEFDFGDNYYSGIKKEGKGDSRQEDDELRSLVKEIIKTCTEKINNGADRDELFQMISDKNGGNKNPNSISEMSVAKEILSELKRSDLHS